MNKVFVLIVNILMVLVILSCGNNQTIKFPEKERLEGEKVPINNVHRMFFLHNTKDYLLLSGPCINDKTLHVYSIPNLEYLGSHFAKGHAANEVLMPLQFCVGGQNDENFVYVRGMKHFNVNGISIASDSAIKIENQIPLKLDDAMNDLHIVDNKYIIGFKTITMEIFKYDIEQRKIVRKITYKVTGEGTDDPNFGELSVNNEYMVYGYRHKKQIDIYDTRTFKLLTTIKGKIINKDVSK